MISTSNVSKSYKTSTRPALDDVTISVDKGEFVFLIGPSGSGKSTFMRLLLKEETPTSGDIHIADFHVNRLPSRRVPKLRQSMGCVFQDFRLLQQKTVVENVAFALEVIGKPRSMIKRTVPEVLDLVGLGGKSDRLPTELSGGEQQRVAIARAFVNRPLVLLADEPTGNLDPDTSQDIMMLLERINRTGTTVLMATHDNHIVDSMRRRVIELDNGRVVRDERLANPKCQRQRPAGCTASAGRTSGSSLRAPHLPATIDRHLLDRRHRRARILRCAQVSSPAKSSPGFVATSP